MDVTTLRKLIRDEAAREVPTDPDAPTCDIDDVTCERIAVAVLAAGLDSPADHLDYGVRWIDPDTDTFTDPSEGDEYATLAPAQRVVRGYADARLVAREVRYSAWKPVSS